MGTINIRFRQQGLGNLPGVRQVDTSPLRDVANQDMASARALAGTIDDLVQGGLRLGNALVEMRAEDNRNEANKLYKDYVTYMDSLTTQAADPNNPNGGKEGLFLTAERDDNAARSLADDLRKGQADMRKAIGLDKQNARVKELFEEMAFSYDRGNALRADAIMAKRFQTSRLNNATATAELKLREVTLNPNAESIATYGAALTDLFNVQGLGEAERALAFEKAQQDLLGSYLAQQASLDDAAHTGAMLGAIEQGELLFPPDTDEATQSFMRQAWDKLPEDARAKVVTGLKAKRDAQAKEEIARLDNAQAEGTTTREALVARREALRQSGVPEAILKNLNTVIATETTKSINTAILGAPDALADAPDAATAEEQLSAYAATLPAYVTESNEWKVFAQKAKRGQAKLANTVTKIDYQEQARQIVYGYDARHDPVTLDPSVKRELLTQMWKEGKISIEDLNKGIAAIDATNDARCAALAREALEDLSAFRRAGAHDWGQEDGTYKYRASMVYGPGIKDGGLDVGAIVGSLRSLYPMTATNRNSRYAQTAELFRDAYEGWAQAVKENPSWTAEECQNAFYAAVRYPLEALYDDALELDEEQFKEHQRRMHVLGMLGNAKDDRIQGNLDFDPSAAEKALWDEKDELTLRARPNAPTQTDDNQKQQKKD